MHTDLDLFAETVDQLPESASARDRLDALLGAVDNDHKRLEASLWAGWRQGIVDIRGSFFFWQHLANRPDDYTIADLAEVYRQLAPLPYPYHSARSAIHGWHGELDRLLHPRLEDAEALLPLVDELEDPMRGGLVYALARHGLLPHTAISDALKERIIVGLYTSIGGGPGFTRWQHVWPMADFGNDVLEMWFEKGTGHNNHHKALSACARHARPALRMAYLQKQASASADGSWYCDLAADFVDEFREPFAAALDSTQATGWHRTWAAGVYLSAAGKGLGAALPPRWDPLLRDALKRPADFDATHKHLRPLLAALPDERRQALFDQADPGDFPWRAVAVHPTEQTARAAVDAFFHKELDVHDSRIEALAAIWHHLGALLSGRTGVVARWLRALAAGKARFRGLTGDFSPDTPGLQRWEAAIRRACQPGVLKTVQHLQVHWNNYRDDIDPGVPVDDVLVGLTLWNGLFIKDDQGYRCPSAMANLKARLRGEERQALNVAVQEMLWIIPRNKMDNTVYNFDGVMGVDWEPFFAQEPPGRLDCLRRLMCKRLSEHPALIPMALRALGSGDDELRENARNALNRLGPDQHPRLREMLYEAPANRGVAELLAAHPSLDNLAPARGALQLPQPPASTRALQGLILDSQPLDPSRPDAEAVLAQLDPGPTVDAIALDWASGAPVSAPAARWLCGALALESGTVHRPALAPLCTRLSTESRAALLALDDRPAARALLANEDAIRAWCAELDALHSKGNKAAKSFSSAVAFLQRSHSPAALWWLDRWSRTVRKAALRASVQQALDSMAAARGQDVDALLEAALPWHGFDEDGSRPLPFGGRLLFLQLTDALEVVVAVDGRLRKRLPRASEGDNPDDIASAKAAFRDLKKALAADVSGQRARLDRAAASGRSWTAAEFGALLRHPVHRRLFQARAITVDGVVTDLASVPEAGAQIALPLLAPRP